MRAGRTGIIAAVAALAAIAPGGPAAAAAARVAPRFPGLMPIRIPGRYSYGGFFAHHRLVRMVFGVSHPDAQLSETLTNAAYVISYLRSRTIRYRIQIVLYGDAVRAADSFGQRYAGDEPLMRALTRQGVEFRVCYNSLVSLHLDPATIYGFVKIVPAGVLQLVKKEMQGYAYISNR